MCGPGGGAPDPPRKDPPPADPPAELILEEGAAIEGKRRRSRKKLRSGRSGLVNSGLTIGASAAQAVTSALGIRRRK